MAPRISNDRNAHLNPSFPLLLNYKGYGGEKPDFNEHDTSLMSQLERISTAILRNVVILQDDKPGYGPRTPSMRIRPLG